MKTKIISAFFLILNVFSYAQVGINTSSPTKTLDVNGSLRVRSTTYKETDVNYTKVLAVNSTGDTDFLTKDYIKTRMSDGVLENKIMYFSTTPSGNTIVPCGRFQLRFNTSTDPQIRLNKPTGSDVDIYYTRIRKLNNSGGLFTEDIGRSLRTNETITISGSANTNNESNWKDIGIVSNPPTENKAIKYDVNTLDEYYISYPGIPNIYRVTFLARTMTQPSQAETYSYTMICEKI